MDSLRNPNQKSGKSIVGIILLAIGCILLLRTLDLAFIPGWIISFRMFLVIIGVFIGARQGYEKPAAFMPILIGLFFLSQRILPDLNIGKFFWPLLIIGFGVWLLTGRKNPFAKQRKNWESPEPDYTTKDNYWSEGSADAFGSTPNDQFKSEPFKGDDSFESVSIFGGVKKNVVSKNFKQGEIVNFFGGAEINLMQADMQGRAKLEVVQVFGGTKIIVPANWTVHSEMVAVFGGIEDKRPPQLNAASDKILIIQGTSIFGGIDIKSF